MIGKFIKATATYDKANKKVYATIDGDVPFSIGDYVVIINGSSFLAKVEAFETMGDGATVRLSFDDIWGDFFWNSGSEKPVLLKELSNSKELEKPSATINVAAVPTPAALSELKRQIALGTISFAEAFALLELDTPSQVTVKIDEGNPKRTAETFCVDKVKAKFSTNGLQILSDRKIGKIFTSDQPVKQVLLPDYLRDMRLASRGEDGDAFVHYNVSLLDDNLKVLLNNQSVKRVSRTRNGGEINYRMEFASGELMAFSGTYNVVIEAQTVKKLDYAHWSGSSGMSVPYLNYWQGLNQKGPVEVIYVKKNNDDLALLELEILNSALGFGFICVSPLALFTVDNRSLFGALKLTEDNRVQITKPANVSELAWAKGMAAIQSSGTGILVQVAQGSPAKDETLQLKVELINGRSTFELIRRFQATTTTSVAQLLPQLGQLKVTDAEIAAAKAGVNTLTGIAALATGTVKWFNDYVEFHVKNNSNETFNVVNSDGADEVFRYVNLDTLLNAVVLENKANYEKELQNIINPTSAVGGDFTVWTANVQVMGESYQVKIWNAEVIQTTSGRIYRLVYDVGIPEQLIRFVNHDDVVILTRTESLRAG